MPGFSINREKERRVFNYFLPIAACLPVSSGDSLYITVPTLKTREQKLNKR